MYEKLEFLLALAREKHFGRAAQVCGVSQPNLSAAIKQLESILGVPLVDRGARFLGFTPEGERVLEWSRRIVGDTRAMRAEVETMKQGLTGHLRLAVIPTALPVVSCLTAAFWKRHPGIKLTVSSHTSTEVLSMLDNLEADAGITYLDNEPLGRVTSVPLYDERYQLITAVGNPYFDRDKVTWSELSQLPLCLLTPDMQNRRIIDQHLAEAGVQVRPTLESNSMIVLFSHIRTGKWSSIMPLNLAETFGFSEPIRAIPITPLVQALLDEAMALADDIRFHR